MRVLMLGTGPFAVPTFEALLNHATGGGHDVAALVTRPDRSVRERYKSVANPMRRVAGSRGIVTLDPEDINTAESRAVLSALSPELLVVCDYGQILAPATLAVAKLGGINLHGSLLPKYRGAAPVQWAMYHGETETGVTVIHMTPRLDAGPCIAQARMPIGADETAADVEGRLAQLGAPLVIESIAALVNGRAEPIPQDPRQATRAPRLRKEDGVLDWSRSAVALWNQIRAFQPWPRSWTSWRREGGEPVRSIIDRAAIEEASSDATPGTVVAADPDRLAVATGAGLLVVEQVQPAGKRAMSAEEFLRGHSVKAGDRLGE